MWPVWPARPPHPTPHSPPHLWWRVKPPGACVYSKLWAVRREFENWKCLQPPKKIESAPPLPPALPEPFAYATLPPPPPPKHRQLLFPRLSDCPTWPLRDTPPCQSNGRCCFRQILGGFGGVLARVGGRGYRGGVITIAGSAAGTPSRQVPSQRCPGGSAGPATVRVGAP